MNTLESFVHGACLKGGCFFIHILYHGVSTNTAHENTSFVAWERPPGPLQLQELDITVKRNDHVALRQKLAMQQMLEMNT